MTEDYIEIDGKKAGEYWLKSRLSIGTWVLIPYGFHKREFCVLNKVGDKVLMGPSNWCVSRSEERRVGKECRSRGSP